MYTGPHIWTWDVCLQHCAFHFQIYLVDISKRSFTELTLHPLAPHLSSSCSQSEADSNQFMWVSRRRLLRNCFISGGRKWFYSIFSQFNGVNSAVYSTDCRCGIKLFQKADHWVRTVFRSFFRSWPHTGHIWPQGQSWASVLLMTCFGGSLHYSSSSWQVTHSILSLAWL